MGGRTLFGEIEVQRAKNAILAMLAASLVVEEGETVLHDVPDIEDVERAHSNFCARSAPESITTN